MKNRTSPENIIPKDNEVFVFGSNEAGIHGAGDAKFAMKFGAEYGVGYGFRGNTFAIPTKDFNIKNLAIVEIEKYVSKFILFIQAPQVKHLTFLVSKIGCGLAGLTVEQISPLFENCVELDNVHLPREFWEVLNNGNEN